MSTTTLNQGTGKELRKLFAKLAESIRETLGSLVGRELNAQPVEFSIGDAESLQAGLGRSHAVVRGALDKDYAGKTLCTLLDVGDACTMAGLLMMTPENVIEQRRQGGKLEGEDKEAFGELANVLCSGISATLRADVTNVDIRLQDHGVLSPGSDALALLPSGPLVLCKVKLRIEGYPEGHAWIVVDRPTAEAWNKGVLDDAPTVVAAPIAPVANAPAADGSRASEEDVEDIPAAPIRGVLHAYLASAELLRVLRRSCRRVGLDLRRHGRAEVPNPAAHRGEIVLLDVPTGEERRIDWGKRLKEYPGGETKVVLLLHRPSRARVTHAFRSQADVILGLPVEEPQLSAKFNSLLEP